MGHGQDDNDEQADDDANDPKDESNNEISGGQFDGPVGQFGNVYGDVNMNPPRSPEEAAFRARYMAKMQEEWDAEERARNQGPSGCMVLFVIVWLAFMAFIVFKILEGIAEHGMP